MYLLGNSCLSCLWDYNVVSIYAIIVIIIGCLHKSTHEKKYILKTSIFDSNQGNKYLINEFDSNKENYKSFKTSINIVLVNHFKNEDLIMASYV